MEHYLCHYGPKLPHRRQEWQTVPIEIPQPPQRRDKEGKME